MPKRKAARDSERVGRRIARELGELADAVEKGVELEKRFTVRRVKLAHAPGEYTARQVRQTRVSLGASQAVFAQLVGVSVALVQAWEQGLRKPSRLARRLLDEINRDRRHWLKMVGGAA